MASVTFALKEPNAIEDTLIILLFRLNNQQWKFSFNQKINPKYWNAKANKAREVRAFPYAELNTMLSNLKNEILDTCRRLTNDGEPITKTRVKEAIDRVLQKDIQVTSNKDFFTFIDNLIENSNKKLFTIKQYKQARRVLKDFQDYRKQPVTFESIDLDFYEGFTKYLTEKGYFTNSIGGFIKNLKVFMNEAVDRGITKNLTYKHKKFKTVDEQTESIYLTTDEIKAMFDEDLSDNERLENVRDLFVIGCYTGLRFSDLAKLSDKNIIDNNTKIKILTEKTGELVIIPLHRYVRDILKRRNGVIPRVISNQKMNEYLKELGAKVNINDKVTIHYTKGGKRTAEHLKKYELITVHTARRSFATNAYLNDIPTISIMKITGHRTEKAFLKYIKISQEDNANKLLNHPFFK